MALQHVDGPCLTYAELHAEGLRWASAFAQLGIGADDHVATMLPNTFDAHRAMLGLGWLRAIEVPLNTAYTGRMLTYALDHADATTLVIAAEYVDELAAVAENLPTLHTVVVLDDDESARVGNLRLGDRRVLDRAELLAGAKPEWSTNDGPEYRDIHSLMFTSGTTGPSKAVITPWAVMYQFWSWVPDDTLAAGDGLYCTMPLFHNSGRSAFNYALVCGARFVLRDRFSAARSGPTCAPPTCTTAALVGPMTALLYSAPPSPDDADNPLRNVILGPMIPEIDDFERRFGVRAATGYGQTEVGMPVTTGWDHGPWANCGRRREDYPWPEVRLVDEHDEPVGAGEVGELVVRSAGAVGAQRRLLQDAGADGGGVAQRLVPHRRRLPLRRRRLVLLRRPAARHHPPARREHLVVRGGDDRGRAPRRARVRRDRCPGGAGRRRPHGGGDRPRARPLRPRGADRVPGAADAAVHGAALRGGGRRPAPAPKRRCGCASTSCAPAASPSTRGIVGSERSRIRLWVRSTIVAGPLPAVAAAPGPPGGAARARARLSAVGAAAGGGVCGAPRAGVGSRVPPGVPLEAGVLGGRAPTVAGVVGFEQCLDLREQDLGGVLRHRWTQSSQSARSSRLG